MTLGTADSTKHLSHLVEGSQPDNAEVEPGPLETSVIPVVRAQNSPFWAAETGLVAAVNLGGEGKDDDETQDESLNSSETTSDLEAKPETEKTSMDAGQRQPTILIVEDTTELAEIIQATLERLDMIVFHETHGNKALQKFNELDPDIVLLDISLPDTTGWKIMDAIKERLEQTAGSMPKVIVITAYDDPANRLIGKLQGVHNYLIKPFTSDQIEELVNQALKETS